MTSLLSIPKNSPTYSVTRWFLIGFTSFSLIFLVALSPLILYCRSVFTELEIKENTQQMDFGIQQLDNTVSTIINASQSISDDHRFYSLHYINTDYSEISVAVRNQMRDYLGSMIRPSDLILDCALQLSANDAVTPTVTTIGGRMGYYPFYFRVNELSFDQWNTVLQENPSGFLPVCHVSTPYNSYDALIYTIQWANNKHFYACLDIAAIRDVLISAEDQSDYRLTIENSKGICLYSNLADNPSGYHSITQKNSSGSLSITVHIPNAALTNRMKPLYSFIGLYLAFCILILAITIIIGTHLSTRPLARIINMLENNTFSQSTQGKHLNKTRNPLGYGFQYIHDQIQTYESNLQQYQTAIDMQAQVLQLRFMEKALQGSLYSESDLDAFFTYFPDFPDCYRLVLFGLSEKPTENGNIYPNTLSIIQYYLQQTLPHAYMQQQTAQTLLLVIPADNDIAYSDTINHLIKNINQEEPCYHAWGMASKFFSHPKHLSVAYLQIQDLRSRLSTESISQLCTVSDIKISRKSGFQIVDAMTIYTAITDGNLELVLNRLQSYAEHLNKRNRSVFEMFRSILLCIKQNYADLLIDTEIPFYHPQEDLYATLEKSVRYQTCA